jgi:hypothetical protein
MGGFPTAKGELCWGAEALPKLKGVIGAVVGFAPNILFGTFEFVCGLGLFIPPRLNELI